MRFGLILLSLMTFTQISLASLASESETQVKVLEAGNFGLVLFMNPSGQQAKTLVLCLPSAEVARELLGGKAGGGVVLLPGSKMTFKNDQNSTFTDGSKNSAKYIRFECQG